MAELNTITLVITSLPNGHAKVTLDMPKPRPGQRVETAAHSLAIDAIGWLGKQPATSSINYCDLNVLDAWTARVRQYLNEETSERFLTLAEILAACPESAARTSSTNTENALRKLLGSMGWQYSKQMRAGMARRGYVRPAGADLLACEALARDLQDPEGFAHSVSAEVRNAARRAIGTKGREGLAA